VKVTVEKTAEQTEVEKVATVHPLLKSHMFVSTKHVNYDNLDAFEAISMTAVFMLAVIVGTVYGGGSPLA
jgi:hypothetical protein